MVSHDRGRRGQGGDGRVLGGAAVVARSEAGWCRAGGPVGGGSALIFTMASRRRLVCSLSLRHWQSQPSSPGVIAGSSAPIVRHDCARIAAVHPCRHEISCAAVLLRSSLAIRHRLLDRYRRANRPSSSAERSMHSRHRSGNRRGRRLDGRVLSSSRSLHSGASGASGMSPDRRLVVRAATVVFCGGAAVVARSGGGDVRGGGPVDGGRPSGRPCVP